MTLTFRKTSSNDWKVVSDLEKSVADSKIYFAITDEKRVKRYLSDSNVYLICLSNNPIGTISFREKSEKYANIDGLTILPKYRGRGYASEAVNWLLEKLSKYNKVDVLTHPNNRIALKIYKKFGFLVGSREENPFGDREPRLRLVRIRSCEWPTH